jgi:limonene-1,2-epoxide hydrolase
VADLRRLEYFLAVAGERNFTGAVERLRIAQPALSGQVRLLEQELGVELLHRTYENDCIGVFTVRDGKIHAVREYMDTLYAYQRADGGNTANR